eukprot:CAMPEP_0168390470 /NCGR_PEP_ID=MMETSP0228-20121227/17491_1 /TAXON_ID=133427 /ORGANISM="Protoceratium reticulatum, Strain CCCM 535 (=CCMP 1889)" /LENGTH=163 /DNA_ID=CAMNT_0008403765 /DNA_START=57 /DNA_END=544 /DNA_ORIENTATION=-
MAATTLARLLLVSAGVGRAEAFSSYQNNIPNGANVMRNSVAWAGVGHNSAGGGGARNAFGLAFANAGRSWTLALCQADSDGDGQSNGFELGDPGCTWTSGATPSRTSDISHPGFSDSTTSASPPPPSTTTTTTTTTATSTSATATATTTTTTTTTATSTSATA